MNRFKRFIFGYRTMVLTKEKLDIMFYRVISVLEVFGFLDKVEVGQLADKLNKFYLEHN